MNCSLISELVVAGNKVSSATENLNGSERDKPIVVQTGHNPFNCIRPKGVCLSLQSVLERTAKADPNRSRSMVRASLCAGGHTKSSDARGRNDPRASREGGINRNPPPLGVGRFKKNQYVPRSGLLHALSRAKDKAEIDTLLVKGTSFEAVSPGTVRKWDKVARC